ncbi:TfoX/Sxy family DNA transformation protein [Zophobihabitans entericus]|uniref:TfoX/Sxy family DNA transformation protein n=1 Tax=Zophobihabitans entericus TaxID=1635327 RepID=A0A6G9IBA2_9GAMM|nr:TfoX/Sxy family DNA transformation protein [Zophobihabitans entericus]QIQ21099.1 TfoX/Sxy family DNA transformation protein [Zophobihabitans entericus]
METNNSKELVQIILNKYSELGYLSSRSMFGGFGISLNGIMFGWVYENQFYLRANNDSVQVFKKLQMPPLNIYTGVISKLLQYYCVTDEIWHDSHLLNELICMSIEGANKDKTEKKRLREQRLKDLPNITLSVERLLVSVGITDIAKLRGLGAVKTFSLLRQQNHNISINMLYILSAAIRGYHVAMLSEDDKRALESEYNQE